MMKLHRGCFMGFIDLVDDYARVETGWRSGSAALSSGGKGSIVAVIHDAEREDASAVLSEEGRVVLSILPVGRVGTSDESKVAPFAQSPKNVAVAGTVLI